MNKTSNTIHLWKKTALMQMLVWASFTTTFSQTKDSHQNNDLVRSPAEVILAYVEAANQNDLESFLALYATGIKKYRYPATLASEGIEHMRKVYTKSFAEKSGIKVEIRSMIALADKVICYDHVTGLPNGEEADEIVVYEVKNGLIESIVYVDRMTTAAKNR
jgi:hypothetical protein